VVRTVPADTRAPAVRITKGPGNKATVRGTVRLTVGASDAGGVAKVQLLVDGRVVATDTRAGWSLSVDTAKRKKTMKVQVRAYDRAGNVAYTTTRTWYRR